MKSPNPGYAVNGFYKKMQFDAIAPVVAKCQFLTDIGLFINNAYIHYLELHFSEIMQFKVEKRIHFESIPTSTSRDELGKLSGQHGQVRVKSTGKTDLGLICCLQVQVRGTVHYSNINHFSAYK